MDEGEPAGPLERLRNVVADCLDKHLLSSAVFFADKLLTLSDGNVEDVFLLAQARARVFLSATAGARLTRPCLRRPTSTAGSTGVRWRSCAQSR